MIRIRLVVLSLAGVSLLGIASLFSNPCFASDCETDRFYDWLNADSNYTSTFRSWYYGDPVSCDQQCTQQCNAIQDPQQRQQCFANIGACISGCNSTRYTAFLGSQDTLMEVASRSCPFNIDFCAQARGYRDQCVMTYNAQMTYPEFDEKGNIDQEWLAFVMNEYSACLMASGVQQCE